MSYTLFTLSKPYFCGSETVLDSWSQGRQQSAISPTTGHELQVCDIDKADNDDDPN